MFIFNRKAESTVDTAIKLIISIVLGGAILFSTTALVNNTVVPGMVKIFEAEHSNSISVSGNAVAAQIADSVNEHNSDANAHKGLLDAKANKSELSSKADKTELAAKANAADLNNKVDKSVVDSLTNTVSTLSSELTSKTTYKNGDIFKMIPSPKAGANRIKDTRWTIGGILTNNGESIWFTFSVDKNINTLRPVIKQLFLNVRISNGDYIFSGDKKYVSGGVDVLGIKDDGKGYRITTYKASDTTVTVQIWDENQIGWPGFAYSTLNNEPITVQIDTIEIKFES